LDITPTDPNNNYRRSSLIAVGLWTDISTNLIRITDMKVVAHVPLAGEIIPRSVLMVRFDDINYILVTLGMI